ncbi:hypothetical protein MMC24_007887 [Lignoscripta atroalba]|nr:hypothetical protein [Lignoscripta atroalba]
MPPTRRTKPARTSSQHSQPTLSFHSRANRVTKPSVAPAVSSSKNALSHEPSSEQKQVVTAAELSTPSTPAAEDVDAQIAEEPTTAQLAIREQVHAERDSLKTEQQAKVKTNTDATVEAKARGIGEGQIKRYWRAKEEGRKAVRVHQEGLSMYEKILREFDLSSQYGITNREANFVFVMEVFATDVETTQKPCIGIARMKRWRRADGLGLKPPIEVLAVLLKEDAKQNVRAERAYVDELMSSKGVTN